MSAVILYDPKDKQVPGRVLTYLSSVNTPDYVGQEGVMIQEDIRVASKMATLSKYSDTVKFASISTKVPVCFLKVLDGKVVEMTDKELDILGLNNKTRLE